MMLRILGFMVFFTYVFMGFMVVLRDFDVAVLNFTECPWDFHRFLSAKMVGFKHCSRRMGLKIGEILQPI